MATATVILTGSKELQARLAALPSNVQKKLARHALRAAAKQIQADAIRFAPEGETHELKDGIKVRAMKRSRTRIGVQVFIDTTTQPTRFHAAFTEFGTRKESPQPFMRPAFEKNKGSTKGLIEEDIREAIEDRSDA